MGLLEPSALVFASFAVLLWWLAWRERRRRVRTVPALFLWQALPTPPARRASLRDWLLILQLGTLAALVLALARPYSEAGSHKAGTRHLLVLDLSASMQAREGEKTRWQLAQAQANEYLDRLAPADEVELVGVAHRLQVLLPATRDREQARRVLADTAPYDSESQLATALAEISAWRQSGSVHRVAVFSDFADPDLPQPFLEQYDLFPVGRTDQNLAIEEVRVTQHPWQAPEDVQATVHLRNFSRRTQHGLLSVESDGQVLLQSGLTLGSGESVRVPLPRLKKSGWLVAKLATDDALATDNLAWAWVAPPEPLELCLVAPPQSNWPWLRALLHSASMLRAAPPECVRERARERTVYLFYRSLPPASFAAPALVIHPPPREEGERGRVPRASIADWDGSHPLWQHALPDLQATVERVSLYPTPADASVALWGRAQERVVPLVWSVSGNDTAGRQVWVTFDLPGKLELSTDDEGWAVFFFETLAFLAPPNPQPSLWVAGRAAPLPPGAGATRIRGPRQQQQTLAPEQNWFVPLWQGEYRLERDEQVRTAIAQAARGAESDIAPKLAAIHPSAASQQPARRPAVTRPRQEWTTWMLALGAIVLLVEAWAVSQRVRWNGH